MAVIEHQGILLSHALAAPRRNPNKKERIEYHASVAFPPEAQADLIGLLQSVTNGAPLSNFYLPVQRNDARKDSRTGQPNPIPGIPSDWLILRTSSSQSYAPACVNIDGTVLTDAAQVSAAFYPGKKVMIDVYVKAVLGHAKGNSIYANLSGIIAQADGERLAIGRNTVGALQKYATPGAVSQAAPRTNAQTVATGPAGAANPFNAAPQTETGFPGATTAGTQPAQQANPFAQAASAASGNPFAQ